MAVAMLVMTAMASEPTEVVLARSWRTIYLHTGEHLDVQLVPAPGRQARYGLRDPAPAGLLFDPSGRLQWTPSADDAGQYRLPMVVEQDDTLLWTGLLLFVAGPPAPAPPLLVPGDLAERVAPPARRRWIRQCFVAPGAQVTFSRNDGLDWSAVGLPDLVVTGSPAIAASCSGGARALQVVVGVDSAPVASYLTAKGVAPHLLGVTAGLQVGGGRVFGGPIVMGGIRYLGAGVRVVALPFTSPSGARHGVELRAVAHPVGLAGSVMAGYTVEFGRF